MAGTRWIGQAVTSDVRLWNDSAADVDEILKIIALNLILRNPVAVVTDQRGKIVDEA